MNTTLTFNRKGAEFYVPSSIAESIPLELSTHLGIGAHQDDLEFMAMHGILECYDSEANWFAGVTCTNGAGSARSGKFAEFTDEQMQAIRAEEQREAARIGKYHFIAQLNYASAEIKGPENEGFIQDLLEVLQRTQPTVLYTHNLADKHSTHVVVALAVIEAIRRLPLEQRPKQVIGCEVWRDLDWLPDSEKVVMNLSANPTLATQLNGVFASQISGGKRYDLAVEGRRRAHATFFDSHSVDDAQSLCFGMDLTPLIETEARCPTAYVGALMDRFRGDVSVEIEAYSGNTIPKK
jgi:LmbE family N-acetylglucosaminyl deacetylase